ncbi:MAG: sulfite exporter TauE/SafE family protein [Bacteroidetes bacterium]|nr:sulfite exporter TauE/SafE family protein [Bacteroidota bacterium]
MTTTLVLTLVIIGLLAGFLSGLIGVGGGIIMVPMFILFLGFTQHQAQGLSLAVLLPPVTFLAVYNYHQAGVIDWRYALIVSVIFIIGGFIGSKVALALDQQTLKKVFGGILLLISIKLILGK